MTYLVTEDQLWTLQLSIWGAHFTSEADLQKYLEIIQRIKNQSLGQSAIPDAVQDCATRSGPYVNPID